MITIWPQNRCISPDLAGNRDFVFVTTFSLFMSLFLLIFGSPAVSTFEAGLIALEDGLNAAATTSSRRKAPWPRPNQVRLLSHGCLFSALE